MMHTSTLKPCGFITRICFMIPKHGFSVLLTIRTKNHWIHIGIHASEHTIIVYDPLRNKNNTCIVDSVVQAYANYFYNVLQDNISNGQTLF